MSSNILEQRKQCFSAWNMTLSRGRMFPPNPRHDRDFPSATSSDRDEELTPRVMPDLSAELAAWEEASDDDFEKFEQSLE